jgi:hypothetical protein
MKKKLALFVFLLGWLGTASAQLVMQGAIQNSLGAPVPNGSYNISFRLYETETGGTPVWSETQAGVPVSGGLYTVSLGAATPLSVPFDKIYYVGVAVNGGGEMIPRSRLSDAP